MSTSAPPSKWTIASAVFLVAGTCIGGGMLALPLATGLNGYFPSLVVMAFCWLAMTLTALILVEITLWFGEGAHIMTMTSHILGQFGKWVAGLVYIFICYASIIAYAAGGGEQVSAAFETYLGLPLTSEWGAVLFVLAFYAIIFLGRAVTGRVNSALFIAMVFAYLMLVGFGLDDVKPKLLGRIQWAGSFMAIPLLLTSFSFQTMVPSLVPYLKENIRALRLTIISGTLLTFIIYAVWQTLMLGIVPLEGEYGLVAAFQEGKPVNLFLQHHVTGKWIYTISEYFAFFAIATSFLGITFGLYDFIADGLHISRKGWGKLWISLLIVAPTIIAATQLERVFYTAMDISGGFGDTILNGMIPVLMLWIGRYKLGYKSDHPLPFGKVVLTLIFLFYLISFGIELADRFGYYDRIENLKILYFNGLID